MDDPTTVAGASPFHLGERDVQSRAGSRAASETIGRRMMRDFMPEQHRAFFPKLPFVVAGAIDASGAPAATLLVGAPGFIRSPDPRRLRIDALPAPDDPLAAAIRAGVHVGLLGIELPTRRRNRANGRVVAVDGAGFDLDVLQSFGNCPKYIQTRELLPAAQRGARPGDGARETARGIAHTVARLDTAAMALIGRADTFFIATSSGALNDAEASASALGVDVSHRGGLPGFVRVDDDATLSFPDFTGNGLFNTLGNLAVSARTGLVFPDFEHGHLLHVSGRGRIVWDGPQVQRFAGAERVVQLQVDRVLLRPAVLPWRGRLIEYSPSLAAMGGAR